MGDRELHRVTDLERATAALRRVYKARSISEARKIALEVLLAEPGSALQAELARIAKADWSGLYPIPTVQIEINGQREIRVDDRGVLRPLNEIERAIIARGEELRK